MIRRLFNQLPFKNKADKLAYNKRYRAANLEKIRAQECARNVRRRDSKLAYMRKSIRFKGKRIHGLSENPRKGICIECGERRLTHMHHDKYDRSDALANTREVCARCHKKIDPMTKDPITGRFLPKS